VKFAPDELERSSPKIVRFSVSNCGLTPAGALKSCRFPQRLVRSICWRGCSRNPDAIMGGLCARPCSRPPGSGRLVSRILRALNPARSAVQEEARM